MKEDSEDQAEFAVWVNRDLRIVTFRETDGYERIMFQSQDEKINYVYRLCESGYRIL